MVFKTCNKCGVDWSKWLPGSRIRHIKTNCGTDKSLGCGYCYKVFTRKDNLTRHISLCHGENLLCDSANIPSTSSTSPSSGPSFSTPPSASRRKQSLKLIPLVISSPETTPDLSVPPEKRSRHESPSESPKIHRKNLA